MIMFNDSIGSSLIFSALCDVPGSDVTKNGLFQSVINES